MLNGMHNGNATHRILVADDDPIIRLLARKSLEQSGFAVDEVADGREAVEYFARSVPSLILLDVLMPERDGFAVCKELRARPEGAEVPILIMTGHSDVAAISQAYEVGATDFITKPINWVILGHRVQYMIKTSLTMQRLGISEACLNAAQRIARMGSWRLEIAGGSFSMSESLHTILGLAAVDFSGTYQSFVSLVHPQDRDYVITTMESVMAGGPAVHIDHKFLLPDGREKFVRTEAEAEIGREGAVVSIVGTIQDITERKQDEERIRYLALYDHLTGLPNRTLFKDRLEQALRQAARNGTMLAVMFVDLDNFKDINDGHGHKVGDLLLQEVAQRLLSTIRKTDTVARMGGDEFTLFVQNIASVEDIGLVADKIVQRFSDPFHLEGQNLFISTSVGIAVYPGDARTVDELLKQADMAMYHAKEQGKCCYRLFSADMQLKAGNRLAMHNELRRALEKGEFILHYQPIFEIATGKLTGVEALVRWQHPQKGLIYPPNFLPMAESIGLIVPLGEWIIREACRQNMKWREAGYPQVKISVNLSPVQFQRGNIAQSIRTAFAETGMAPQMLQIDIRENMLLQSCEAVLEVQEESIYDFYASEPSAQKKTDPVFEKLIEIKKMGVSIALDDFGTGYSSLSYLSNSPINVLKIDRRFVESIKDDKGSDIVLAILALSKKLGMKVIAEGVETDAQKLYLLMEGCKELQGFLVGKPVKAEEFVGHFPPSALAGGQV